MASALELSAAATIINGLGITTNSTILSQISTVQTQTTTVLLAGLLSNANAVYGNANVNGIQMGNVGNVIVPILNTIANSRLTQGHFFLDLYPSNISAVCTGSIPTYASGLQRPMGALQSQANGPFSHGLAGFANIFSSAYGQALTVYDAVVSTKILENKTYAQSGLGYTNRLSLATNGVGSQGVLLSSIVSGWGTMYDTTNLNLIGDPYVFGQNLLNQGCGAIGDLGEKLSATGLDLSDITKIPPTITTATTQQIEQEFSSTIGSINLPITNVTYNTNTVTGNSVDVILAVYTSITGDALNNIIATTGFTDSTANIATLADFLVLNKVVSSTNVTALNTLGVTDFNGFGTYIHSRIGHGSFISWKTLGKTLGEVEVPTLVNSSATTGASTVLTNNTISTIRSATGVGSGALNNPIIADYLGACAGMPYTILFPTILATISASSASATTSLQNLNRAVTDTINYYIATSSTDPESGATGGGTVRTDWVSANLVSLQNTLNSYPSVSSSQQVYYQILNRLTAEVAQLATSNGTFTATTQYPLLGFGLGIGSIASDKDIIETYQFFANLITSSDAGDSIRAVIAEVINIGVLSAAGITMKNDPQPMVSVAAAKRQGVSLTTYLNQNQ